MNSERYEDCDVCGERFVGMQAIRGYLTTVDVELLYAGSRIWRCYTVCKGCIQKGKVSAFLDKQKKMKRKA